MHAKFKGGFLKQDKPAFNHGKIVNIYIVYDLESNLNNFVPALENCLFEAVKLTKNSDIDKYKYAGYGIGFDSKGNFLFSDGSFGQNVIIFGADMSSSVHANNKVNNILVLGKEFIQRINGTTIYAAKMYSINFTKNEQVYIIMVIIVIYLPLVQRFVNLKQKTLKLYQLRYVWEIFQKTFQ